MADVLIAASEGLSRGKRWRWELFLDDPANTSTIVASYVDVETGQPVAPPSVFSITVTTDTGADLNLDLLTGNITPGGFWDTNRNMVNDGPRVRTKVPVRVSADRAAALTFTTGFQP